MNTLKVLFLASLVAHLTPLAVAQTGAVRPGFTQNTLAANDDGSTSLVPLDFNINFYGQSFTSAYVNNNGNITFDAAQTTYTPYPISTTSRIIVAPFFGDVDTRGTGSQLVTYSYGTETVNGHAAFGVNWVNVGYYDSKANKLNSFQLVLIERADTGAGNFDIEFNYNKIQWETGDASGGTNGLGGTSARVGYSNGTTNSFELPGSGVNGAFLDSNTATGLIYNSINSTQPGRYVFQVRTGTVNQLPPVAIAGAPQNAVPGETSILDASSSYDPQSLALNFAWTQVSGAPATLVNASTAQASFVLPNVVDTFTFQVNVSNGLLSSTATTQVITGIVATKPATSVTTASAVLNGTLNSGGSATSVSFEYGTTTAYGSTTPSVDGGSSTTPVNFSAPISGLAVGTIYHFRAIGVNVAGTIYGIDQTFDTTANLLPVTFTAPATAITLTGATLNASAIPNGSSASVYFEYGLNTSYGQTTAPSSIGSGLSAVPVQTAVTGLSAHTTYHFRAVSTNGIGSTRGADMTFSTLPPVVTSSTASLPLNAATVIIHGTGFVTTAGNNTVVFNDGAAGTVTAATTTALTVTFTTKPVALGSLTAIVTTGGVSSGSAVQVATVVPVVTASTANLLATAPGMVINGFGFDTAAGNNTVVFSNGTAGTVTAATTTSLLVAFTVQPSVAGSLTVIVTTNGLSSGNAVQVASILIAPSVNVNTGSLAINTPTIIIGGTNFSTTPGSNSVAFNNGAAGTVTTATTTSLTVTFTTQPTALGSLTAVVTNLGGSSGAPVQVATIVVPPTVTVNNANLAISAPTISIKGTNFSTTAANNTVVFNNGAVGTVAAATTNFLTVTFTTQPAFVGPLTAIVTTDGQSSGSAVQVATLTPVVTPQTSNLAINASTLMINGFGFDPTAANNTVAFNDGAAGTITAATTTSLTVTFTNLPLAVGSLTAIVTTDGQSSGNPVQVASVVSSDATLSSLSLSFGKLIPAFASATPSYTVYVSSVTSSVTVSPTLAESHATIRIQVNGGNFAAVNGGVSDALALNTGTNSINLEVTAQDGATSKTYTLIVIRAAVADSAPPTVTITAPAASAQINENLNGMITVTGTAADNRGIAFVEAAINNDGFAQATSTVTANRLTATYTTSVIPVPGRNTVTVRATDTSGNVSSLVTRAFIYAVPRPLNVIINPIGGGTISYSPALVSGNALVGMPYTLTETPAAGRLFDGWTAPGVSGPAAIARTLSFVMPAGTSLNLTASFITNPFLARAGSYSGLITPATGTTPVAGNTGFFTATVTGLTGAFTANVTIDGSSAPLVGTFDQHTGTATISSPSSTFTYALALDVTGSSDTITGSIIQRKYGVTQSISNLRAYLNPFSAALRPPSTAVGAFTVALPARTSQSGMTSLDYPQGAGIGRVTVTSAGVASFSGTLADGFAVTGSAPLSRALIWPMYLMVSNRQGIVAGEVAFVANVNSDLAAAGLLWIRPYIHTQYYPWGWDNGILVDLVGARYIAPSGKAALMKLGTPNVPAGNATLTFSQGGLSAPKASPVNISTASNVSAAVPGDTSFTATIAPATGLFSGTFNYTVSPVTTSKFNGVILQKGTNNAGFGYFLTPNPVSLDGDGLSGNVKMIGN